MSKSTSNITKMVLDSGKITVPAATEGGSETDINLVGYISEEGAKFNPGKKYQEIKFGNAPGKVKMLDTQEPSIEFSALEDILGLFQSLNALTGNTTTPLPETVLFTGSVLVNGVATPLVGYVQVDGEKFELAMAQKEHAKLAITLNFVPAPTGATAITVGGLYKLGTTVYS